VCIARRKFSAQNFCAEKEGKFCTASSTPPYEKWEERGNEFSSDKNKSRIPRFLLSIKWAPSRYSQLGILEKASTFPQREKRKREREGRSINDI
jgi:hypothetical protein